MSANATPSPTHPMERSLVLSMMSDALFPEDDEDTDRSRFKFTKAQ